MISLPTYKAIVRRTTYPENKWFVYFVCTQIFVFFFNSNSPVYFFANTLIVLYDRLFYNLRNYYIRKPVYRHFFAKYNLKFKCIPVLQTTSKSVTDFISHAFQSSDSHSKNNLFSSYIISCEITDCEITNCLCVCVCMHYMYVWLCMNITILFLLSTHLPWLS